MSSLNIFDDAVNENGLSRCVAIILNEHPLFRDRFIDLMNRKLSDKNREAHLIVKPSSREEFQIEIQKASTTLVEIAKQFKDKNVNRIIPVTLTPDEAISEEAYDTSGKNPIPDIAFMSCNEDNADLILIKAKLYGNYAEGQVKGQAENIMALLNADKEETESKAEVLGTVIHLTWKEITGTMQQVKDMMPGLESLLIEHYLELIGNRFSYYIPAKPFKIGMSEKEIHERMNVLAGNLAKKFRDEDKDESISARYEDYYGRRITKNFGYAESFLIFPAYSEAQMNFHGIEILILIGYLKRQDQYLLSWGNNILEDMSWTYNESEEVEANGHKYKMSVEPILLFRGGSRQNSPDLWKCPLNKRTLEGKKRDEIRQIFLDEFYLGIWPQSSWDELRKRLKALAAKNLLDRPDELESSFASRIENVGYKSPNVTLLYSTSIFIPAKDIESYDKGSNLNKSDDKVAELIFSVIHGLMKKIEK